MLCRILPGSTEIYTLPYANESVGISCMIQELKPVLWDSLEGWDG